MFTTYDFFDDVVRLRHMVDSFFRDIPTTGSRIYDFPYVNIKEKGDNLELDAIVPGVAKDDLTIELRDNNLILQGERKSDITDKPYIRKERTFGKFNKAIKLPFKVKQDNIDASLKNGLLTIKLEKSDEAKPKRIEIK